MIYVLNFVNINYSDFESKRICSSENFPVYLSWDVLFLLDLFVRIL